MPAVVAIVRARKSWVHAWFGQALAGLWLSRVSPPGLRA
ncbi:hypothetical protein MMSP_0511 [Mycobacterium sp. 012931]|nr:hypothetical protein MMSP_0511 [Mycobacterium sp. 012931]